MILFFPKTNHKRIKTPQPQMFKMLFTALSFIFKTPKLFKLGIIFFLFQLGYMFYFQMLALNLQQNHNFSISQTGVFFFAMGICYTFGMYIVHPFFNRRLSNSLVADIGVIAACLIVGILGINELFDLFIKKVDKIYILWVFNMLFFIIIPLASINIYKQFIEMAKGNQGLIMGAAGQINAMALIFSAILISFHVYLGHFVLLITSFMMFIILILKVPGYIANINPGIN